MGNSAAKQRGKRAGKTGVYAVKDERFLSFPDKVFKIENLRSLAIESCHLSSLPEDFGSLGTSLKKLSLSGNSLSKFPDPRPFSLLEALDLSQNSFKQIPEGWNALGKLSKLSLSGNRLESIPVSLTGCAALTILDLSKNRLTSLPGQIGLLQNLTDFDVSDNLIVVLPPEMSTMRKLKRLTLTNNKLESVPEGLLTSTPVEKIIIDGNPVVLDQQAGFESYNDRRVKIVDKQLEMMPGQAVRKGL